MENNIKKYELINSDGCLFDSIITTSFKKAREYFAGKYEGKFTVLCAELEERKNVIL